MISFTMKNKSFFLACLIIFNNFIHFSAFALKNNITIAGSTTIMPVSEKWAKSFKEKTGVNVNVHGGGSTSGIKATKIGTADIGASSRELNKSEKENLNQIVIGKDALAIIVNKTNPIENVTIDEARAIFTGRINNWSVVGGPNKPIQVVNRESGSGTRDLFTEIIMYITLADKTKKVVPMSLRSVVNNSNAEVKESVKLMPNSVGYISVGYLDSSVKALKINSIGSTSENIYSGKYPLVRNLYYLFKEDKNKNLKEFLAYVLSKEGQSLVKKEGFLPVQ